MIAMLGLAALDQAAVDSGSWILANEIPLEPSPPFGAFARARTLESFESRQTKLLDARWMSVLMGRIRERDAFHTAKRNLGSSAGLPSGGGGGGLNPNRGDAPTGADAPGDEGWRSGRQGQQARGGEVSPASRSCSTVPAASCGSPFTVLAARALPTKKAFEARPFLAVRPSCNAGSGELLATPLSSESVACPPVDCTTKVAAPTRKVVRFNVRRSSMTEPLGQTSALNLLQRVKIAASACAKPEPSGCPTLIL